MEARGRRQSSRSDGYHRGSVSGRNSKTARLLRLLASCFEHSMGSHEDQKQLIEDHDGDLSMHCASGID